MALMWDLIRRKQTDFGGSMDKFTSWHDRLHQHAGSWNHFKGLAPQEIFIGQVFFGAVEKRGGSVGLYLELFRHQSEGQLTARTERFVVPYKGLYSDVKAEEMTLSVDGRGHDVIEMNVAFERGKIFTMDLTLELAYGDTDEPVGIASARAHLKKDAQKAQEVRFSDLNIPPMSWPDRSRNVWVSGAFASDARALCPSCFGNGSLEFMKIPKADWESGMTGYALFQCNRLAGREACEVCGGSGGEYLEWYVEENPHLRKVGFTSGSGMQAAGTGLL